MAEVTGSFTEGRLMALMALGILDRHVVIEAPPALIEDLTVIFPTARVLLDGERAGDRRRCVPAIE